MKRYIDSDCIANHNMHCKKKFSAKKRIEISCKLCEVLVKCNLCEVRQST